MLERSPYPLLSLKLLGSLCPCLEGDGDGPARRAAWALSAAPPVRWHRRLRGPSSSSSADGGPSAGGAVGGFLSGMFGGGSSSGGGGGGGGRGDSYDPIEGAALSVVDAPGRRGPNLVIGAAARRKVVPLRLVRTVRARKGGMLNLTSRSGVEVLDRTGREVLRFDVLKRSDGGGPPLAPSAGEGTEDEDWESAEEAGGEAEDADEATRDGIIDQLTMLVEWERRRQAYLVTLGEDDAEQNADEEYVDEYDDDDEGTTPDSPRRGKKKGILAEKGP